MQTYFVKSFEEDHSTKTLNGKKKVTFQTLADILKTRTIRPNTKSFGQEMRLSTTILHDNYTKTYRPQGIIFTTKQKPSFVLPFDLVLLSQADKIIVHYYRIKNHLHLYYNHQLIDGYKEFVFKDIREMLRKYPSPKAAWKAVNMFRKAHGYPVLPQEKYRLAEYNEAVFLRPVKITPIALFGYRKESRELSRTNGMAHYVTARAFYERECATR